MKFKEKLDNLYHKIFNKFSKIDSRGRILYKKTRIRKQGENNRLYIVKNHVKKEIFFYNYKKHLKGIEIIIKGNNNKVEIEIPTDFRESKLILKGNNNVISIKKTKYKIDKSMFRALNGARLYIGEDLSISQGANIIISGKNKAGYIGSDCMFSSNIKMMNNDGHLLYNIEHPEIRNTPNNIVIGRHVWLGQECIVLNNTIVPSNSMVGCRAVLNKQYTLDALGGGGVIAGIPACVKKEGIAWERKPIFE